MVCSFEADRQLRQDALSPYPSLPAVYTLVATTFIYVCSINSTLVGGTGRWDVVQWRINYSNDAASAVASAVAPNFSAHMIATTRRLSLSLCYSQGELVTLSLSFPPAVT